MVRFLFYLFLAVANLAFGLWYPAQAPLAFGPGAHFWLSGVMATCAACYFLEWWFAPAGRRWRG